MENPPKNVSKMSHGKGKQEVLCDIINGYKSHASIKQIEKKFKPVAPPEIEKLIKCLDISKAAGIDTIPPKLIKIAADFLIFLSHDSRRLI